MLFLASERAGWKPIARLGLVPAESLWDANWLSQLIDCCGLVPLDRG